MRYINLNTGEIIKRLTKLGAYIYFKRDGKRCDYKTKWDYVIPYKKYLSLLKGQTDSFQTESPICRLKFYPTFEAAA